MKKAILAIIVVILVFAFTLPIYAAPGDPGQAKSWDAQAGTRASGVLLSIANISDVNDWIEAGTGITDIPEFTNFGQVMKWANNNLYGVPPAK